MDLRQAGEVTAIIIPLALYFGFLGLVNIRRRPTVISGRLDFLVVILAFLPLLYHPVRMVMHLGNLWWQAAVIGAVAIILWLLLPREFTSWVVYSVSESDLARAIEHVLRRMKVPFTRRGNRIECEPPNGALVISNMPILRNVTIYLEHGGDPAFFAQVGRELTSDLSRLESRPSLSGHCFIAVAVSLLITPLLMIAHSHDLLARLRHWLGVG